MLSQTIEDVGTLEKYTLRHPVTTKVTTGVQLPSPPLYLFSTGYERNTNLVTTVDDGVPDHSPSKN
jgi:hypothetical protein